MGKDLKGNELGKGIRQNKNGRYEARFVDRFGERKSIYATSKVEVRNKLKEALNENLEKKSVKKRMLLKQWYEEWMRVYKIPVIRKNTKKHYEHIFRSKILPVLGDMYMDEIKQIHVQSLITSLEKKDYSWETLNKTKILILDLFNMAIINDYAIKNPTKGIRITRVKPNERVVLTIEQQKDFFECCAGTFYNNLYVVAVNSGLRQGELCGLTEEDLDFKNHCIKVSRTLLYEKFDEDETRTFHFGEPKTKNSTRLIPMTEECEQALKSQMVLKRILAQKYVKNDEFSSLLFVTKFNTPICAQVMNDSILRIIKEINLQRDVIDLFPDFSSHTFRHTFATRCIEAGISPKVLQGYLGHATLEMTMNLYVHTTENFKQEEIKKLSTTIPKIKKLQIVSVNGVKVG